MSSLEIGLIGLLALWALASLLYLFRIPVLQPWFLRRNRSRLLVRWSVFSPSDPSLRPGTFELLYRDRGADGRVTPWRVGASGHSWSGCAAFWLPERLLATALQNHGRHIRALLWRENPATAAAAVHAQILAGYLGRQDPRAAGDVREFQLVRRFASDGTAEDVLEFSDPPHGRAA